LEKIADKFLEPMPKPQKNTTDIEPGTIFMVICALLLLPLLLTGFFSQ